MPLHRSRAAGLALALTVGLVALPACGKKKDTEPDGPAPGPGAGGDPSTPRGGLGLSRTNKAYAQASDTNLKQIGLALHNAHDAYGRFPVGVTGPDGKTLGLSWRVAILPYIEQDSLYRQFKLNEPWDSEHNKKLIGRMPGTFAPPGGLAPAGYTYYRAFTGPGTVFNPQPGRPSAAGQFAFGLGVSGVTDGLSNTMLVAEAADAAVWTKPDELPLAAKGPPPKLGGVFVEGTTALLGDGSRIFLPANTPADTLRALITASGGEIVNLP